MFGISTLAVSPDGAHLAIHDPRSATTIKILPVVGGEPRELLELEEGSGRILAVTWTPDGRHLLFAKIDSGHQCELWRITTEGGEPERVDELPLDPRPSYTDRYLRFGVAGSSRWPTNRLRPPCGVV